MNVTELARKVKMQTAELRELIPKLGFDIGKKAIKVDDAVAEKIIEKLKERPDLIEIKKQSREEVKREPATAPTERVIELSPYITVRDFATMIEKPVASVIQELMKNGILANLNERIDFETAAVIASDFGIKVHAKQTSDEPAASKDEDFLRDDHQHLKPRPPVIVVMGHVDHGKTMLLDAIRKTHVVEQEAGGITQHMGSYQVAHNGKVLTFIDTPGHEAFTTMRSRGARVADIAVLVVAADEGIKPQTIEAIKIIRGAELPFVVALNKIDRPEANADRVMRQLAEQNLLPEAWGGKTITVPVSAKTSKGIEELLNTLLLVTDVEREHIRGNPNREAVGIVIESHVDKGEGPTAMVIIQTGTLRTGQIVRVGAVGGKVKAMKNYLGETINEATPSMPVRILGLKDVPEVGDILHVESDPQTLKKLLREHRARADEEAIDTTTTKSEDEKETIPTLNVVLRTDTLGSQEAIVQELEKAVPKGTNVQITKKGLGNITDADILTAESSQAVVYGFHVAMQPAAQKNANEKQVPVRIYKIIYELVDNVKQELINRKPREIVEVEIGRMKVSQIFRQDKKYTIAGGQITKGKVTKGTLARVLRGKETVGEGKIEEIRKGTEQVSEASSGTECGVKFFGTIALQVGDTLELFSKEERS